MPQHFIYQGLKCNRLLFRDEKYKAADITGHSGDGDENGPNYIFLLS